MKNSLYHLCPLWLLAIVLLTACSGNPKVDALIACADSLMASRPDSSLHLLDSVEAQMADAPKSVRMRYQLLRHKAMNKAYVTFTSDSVMNEVVEYYDNKGDANDQLLAHYLLGCVYRDLDQVPHAVDCYQDAIAKADTLSADCDYQTVSCVYSQMAWLFHQQLLLTNEVEAHRLASHYSYVSHDTLNAIFHIKSIAGAYILMNKTDSAEIILKKALNLYRFYGYDQAALRSSLTLLYLYVETLGKYTEAKILIDSFETKSQLFDAHHELPSSLRQYYYYKGKYYEANNQLDSAEYYYRKVYRPRMTPVQKNPMYKGLLSIYKKRHQADSIAKYAQLYCLANDSSVVRKDQAQTALLAASYDYHYFKEQSLENENKALWAFIAFAVTLLLLAVLVVGVIYIAKRFRKVLIRLRRIHSEREEELLQRHQREKNELQRAYYHKQEQTKLEYEQKLSQLKSRQKEELNTSKKKEMSRKYFSHDIVLRSIRIANDPRQSLTEKFFNDLLSVTYEHFPMMQQELEQIEAVTTQMKRVCVLSILDVHVDDIARLLKVSPQRITNLRAELSLILFNKKSARLFESKLQKHFGIKKV